MQPADSISNVTQAPTGVVELREDAPLKGGEDEAGCACAAGGPRLILASFAVLSAAVTVALLTQIYYGDYQVAPHGGVSSDAAQCSRAGTDALQAGGGALDAAAAAALCLAVVAPHRTSLDASGSMLFWEYRKSRSVQPLLVEWGAGVAGLDPGAARGRPPRLLRALAALHTTLGRLPWSRLLQPAIYLARNGFVESEGLSRVAGSAAGTVRSDPALAEYLQSLQNYSSAEVTKAWSGWGPAYNMSHAVAERVGAGAGWRAWAGGAGAGAALHALRVALSPLPPATPGAPSDIASLTSRVADELRATAASPGGGSAQTLATGLAVVDGRDNYLALVTGLSVPFGSEAAAGAAGAAGWRRDEPATPLDLAPAIFADQNICGTRYVVGAGAAGALAQAAAAVLLAGAAGAVERARVGPGTDSAAVNVVQQRGDSLQSHADSRGGGLASRF